MDEKRPERISDDLEWEAGSRAKTRPPEEFANPAGVGGDTCDAPTSDLEAEPCDPTEIEDMVLQESKPGIGIEGYEGEEVGGG